MKKRSARATAPLVSSRTRPAAANVDTGDPAEVDRAEVGCGEGEVGGAVGARARGAGGPALDEPAPAVRRTELVDQLDHQGVVGAVGAGAERRGDVDDPHPQVVAQLPDAQPASVGEAPPQRVVDRPVSRHAPSPPGRCRRGSSTSRLRRRRRRPATRSPATCGQGTPSGQCSIQRVPRERVGRPVGAVVYGGEEARAACPGREDRRPPVGRSFDLADACAAATSYTARAAAGGGVSVDQANRAARSGDGHLQRRVLRRQAPTAS